MAPPQPTLYRGKRQIVLSIGPQFQRPLTRIYGCMHTTTRTLISARQMAQKTGVDTVTIMRAAIGGRIRPDFTMNLGRLLFYPERVEEIRQILKP